MREEEEEDLTTYVRMIPCLVGSFSPQVFRNGRWVLLNPTAPVYYENDFRGAFISTKLRHESFVVIVGGVMQKKQTDECHSSRN